MAETTEINTDDLRALFDLAVNSMDFGSGFWEHDDTEVARRVAVVLGVDPMVATPHDARRHYPHLFVAQKAWNGVVTDFCSHCGRRAVEHVWPEGDAVETVPDRSAVGGAEGHPERIVKGDES